MIELLDRNEIPMQPLDDRRQDISATVPVHLGTLSLSTEAKEAGLEISEAMKVVRDWYDEDMASYLGYLQEQGYNVPHLAGYEEFRPEWSLDAKPSESGTGYLKLIWKEGDEIHPMVHDAIPQPLFNQRDENGNFYTPEAWTRKRIFPLFYRNVIDPIAFFVTPEKMKQYGVEVPEIGAIIDPVGGLAEVLGTTFTSAYQSNLAKALLLRNFGVYYVNQLAASLEVPDQTKV